jgi:transposase
MAKYKPINYKQLTLVPVDFAEQILPGSFEHTLHHLIEDELLNLKAFDEDYHNDDGGAPAYNPRILLKIILFAYSKGILSSRRIAHACEHHIVFIALSANSCPHFTTIANFVSGHSKAIAQLFRDVLWVCDRHGLIGREMFAIDGCKLPSNASKEWSGTRADFEKKAQKIETAIERMLAKHQQLDQNGEEADWVKREQQQIDTLRGEATKLRTWLADNPQDKHGPSGKINKSNITDPESAKMKCHRGVIQGYNGVAAVDSKHQIIVAAQAHGYGQESHLVKPLVQTLQTTFRGLLEKGDIFKDQNARLLADAGYHSGENMVWLEDENIDAYIADGNFRKRDPRFQDADRHKPKKSKTPRFQQKDFTVDLEQLTCRCPAGHELYLKNRNFQVDGRKAIAFMARQSDCGPCPHRSRCLKKATQKSPRQIHWFLDTETEPDNDNAMERMKAKIDSDAGRQIYSQRLGIVEPVFGNVTSTHGMDYFTLRGTEKVNAQWQLFALVHNIGKLQRYGCIGN